jgi:hypothetical protein
MVEKFKFNDTTYISKNDPLREKKINALNSIQTYYEGLDKDIRKQHFEKVIENYAGEWQNDKEFHELINSSVYNPENFWWNWYNKIGESKNEENIEKISNVVRKAVLKYGPRLTKAVQELREKNRDLCEWSSKQETSTSLAQKLAEFERRYPYSESAGSDWNYVLARGLLKDKLWYGKLEKQKAEREAEKAERVKKLKTDNQRNSAKNILKEIREAEFKAELFGEKNMVSWPNRTQSNGTKHNAIGTWKERTKNAINRLDDELLETGKKKVDLLKELNETIETKTKFLPTIESNSVNSPQQSQPKSSLNEYEKLIDETKEKAVKGITKALQEAKLSQSNLEDENQNWQEQIELAAEEGSATKIEDIENKLLADISNKKETKENDTKLDNWLEKFSDKNKQVGNKEFTKALKEVNQNLGDQENQTKAEEVKKAMLEQNPELYFETFVKWVKEEMEVCGIKENELEDQERKLIKGEIVGLSEAEKVEIEKKLEEKVATKKQSWSFSQKLSEWQNWLKTRAAELAVDHFQEELKKIKRQIYSFKSGANSLKLKAFKQNEKQVNKLLADLNNFSQKDQKVTPTEKNFWKRPEVIIPTVLGIGLVIVIVGVIIRGKRKQVKVKK